MEYYSCESGNLTINADDTLSCSAWIAHSSPEIPELTLEQYGQILSATVALFALAWGIRLLVNHLLNK